MLQQESIVQVGDNTLYRKVRVIKVMSKSRFRIARIGDIVMVTPVVFKAGVNKREMMKAIVVNTRKECFRGRDGTYVSFLSNQVLILKEYDRSKELKLLATRVMVPIPYHIVSRFDRLSRSRFDFIV